MIFFSSHTRKMFVGSFINVVMDAFLLLLFSSVLFNFCCCWWIPEGCTYRCKPNYDLIKILIELNLFLHPCVACTAFASFSVPARYHLIRMTLILTIFSQQEHLQISIRLCLERDILLDKFFQAYLTGAKKAKIQTLVIWIDQLLSIYTTPWCHGTAVTKFTGKSTFCSTACWSYQQSKSNGSAALAIYERNP